MLPHALPAARPPGHRDRAGHVWVTVEDTGCGIPPADIPRVFTPVFTTKGEHAPPGRPQDDALQKRLEELDVTAVLLKPVELHELLRAIRTALAAAQPDSPSDAAGD